MNQVKEGVSTVLLEILTIVLWRKSSCFKNCVWHILWYIHKSIHCETQDRQI